jgi:iron(III) transport system ATP-binding protein
MIEISGIEKRFGSTQAVASASLEVAPGEFVALLGPSGCGKTTLLRLIAGFETPDAGTIRVGGIEVAGPGVWVAPEKRRVGMVFQDYALFPHLTVAENVGYALPRRERSGRVDELLALVELAGYGKRYPHELSGGQQQRVALARALAPEPAVILLDEPWSNIDPLLRTSMREELAAILREIGITALLVTHDREEAFSLSDRIALMRGGQIEQVGTAEQVYLSPASRWAAEFAGAGNFLAATVDDGVADTALGRFPTTSCRCAHAAEALVRPELIKLVPSDQGGGRVVLREFRGHDVFYRVILEDGTCVCAQRPSNEIVPLGARVEVEAQATDVPVFT